MPQQFPALGLPDNNQALPEQDLLSDLISQQQGRLTGLENQGEDPRIAQLMEAVQASQQPVGLNTPEKILTALNSVAFLADRFSKKPRGRSAPQKFAQNLQGIQAGPQGRKQAQQQKLQSELFIQNFLKDIGQAKDTKRGRISDRLAGLTKTQASEEGADRRNKAAITARNQPKPLSPKEKAEQELQLKAQGIIDNRTDSATGSIDYAHMTDVEKDVLIRAKRSFPDVSAAGDQRFSELIDLIMSTDASKDALEQASAKLHEEGDPTLLIDYLATVTSAAQNKVAGDTTTVKTGAIDETGDGYSDSDFAKFFTGSGEPSLSSRRPATTPQARGRLKGLKSLSSIDILSILEGLEDGAVADETSAGVPTGP